MSDVQYPVIFSHADGLLDILDCDLKQLVRTHPISNSYHVEETPFARGKFATVRNAYHLETGTQYAAKFIRKNRRIRTVVNMANSNGMNREAIHEIAVLLKCADSPKLVRLHEVFETKSEIVLLLELCSGGELQRVLDTDECLTEAEACRAMRQILDGLRDLHSQNIAHLDLKPQNVLLTCDVITNADIKLCDFGISRLIQKGVEVREILGTPDYVAPEILNYEPISLATDIWSIGVLAYVLLTGYSPFGSDTKQETYLNISQCNLSFPSELFTNVSSFAQDFIQAALVLNPRSRPNIDELLNHPWLICKIQRTFSPVLNSDIITTTTSTTTETVLEDQTEGHCTDLTVTLPSTSSNRKLSFIATTATSISDLSSSSSSSPSPTSTHTFVPCFQCGTTCCHSNHSSVIAVDCVALSSGGIVSMPWLLLDPRRPSIMPPNPDDEIITPYKPELPISTDSFVNCL